LSEKEGNFMRDRLMRLAAALGTIVAMLVAGGARWKA
jgi:hypothetical protein